MEKERTRRIEGKKNRQKSGVGRERNKDRQIEVARKSETERQGKNRYRDWQ